MKQTFKNYFKLGILLFGISLTLVNCQKDDDLEKIQPVQKSNFSITKIRKTKVQENRTVFSKLTNLKEKLEVKNTNAQNKEIASSEHGFTIDTDYATYIESIDGLYHSFTFYVKRDEPTSILENLLVSLQEDGTYKMSLITYNFTAQEKQDYINGLYVDLSDKIHFNSVNDDGLIFDIFGKISIDPCIQINHTSCDNGDSYQHAPEQYNDGSYCTGSGLEINTSNCDLEGGGGNTNPNDGNPNSPVETTNSGVTPHPSGGGGDATTLVLCENCEEIEECSSDLAIALITNRLTGLTPEQLSFIEDSDNCEQTTAIQDYLAANQNDTSADTFAQQSIEALINDEVETFEEFIKQELNLLLEENPFLLTNINCDQIENWQALAQYNIPQSVHDRINQLDNEHDTFFTDYEIQSLTNSAGKIVNLDYFPVKIDVLPINPSNGQQFTADEFLNYIRTDINTFVDPFWAEFHPANEVDGDFSINDTELWGSDNPLGAIVHINIPGDQGTVVCSDYSNHNWIFTTLEVPWDDEHPVSGNRDFGYVSNPDGSYIFYTRGVDRMTDAYDYIIEIGEDLLNLAPGVDVDVDMFSLSTDNLWISLQTKIANYANVTGSATIQTPITSRPDWAKVRDVLLGNKPISELGCE